MKESEWTLMYRELNPGDKAIKFINCFASDYTDAVFKLNEKLKRDVHWMKVYTDSPQKNGLKKQ